MTGNNHLSISSFVSSKVAADFEEETCDYADSDVREDVYQRNQGHEK